MLSSSRWAVVALLLIIFHLLMSCHVLDSPRKGDLEPIEGRIIFWLQGVGEDAGAEGRALIKLSMATEKIYPNNNYLIESRLFVLGHLISLRIMGIHIPDIVLPAIGPARGHHDLALSPGQYQLCFSNGFMVDRYRLSITDLTIEIDELTSSFTVYYDDGPPWP